jgi:hypothetical protein
VRWIGRGTRLGRQRQELVGVELALPTVSR